MGILSAGVLLWSGAHPLKRLLPTQREALGSAGQLVITVLLVASLVLMISGYRSADSSILWVLSGDYYWAVAPLLSLPFYLFAVGGFPFSLCPPRSYPASAGFIGIFRNVPGKLKFE